MAKGKMLPICQKRLNEKRVIFIVYLTVIPSARITG